MEQLSKWRNFLWPIHRSELKKVIPMLMMFFMITFNYTVLKDIKDTLLITAPGSGAEVIPFIKVWCVVPGAILFMLYYAKMSNLLSRKQLFLATISPFILFFALFAFFLYPYRDLLQPESSATWLAHHLPVGFKGLIALYRNWTFTVFYVLAELWGSVMLTLVFWGFANQITRLSEASRFYALFGLGGNCAPFFAGMLMVHLSSRATNSEIYSWQGSLQILLSITVIVGVLIIFCYNWIFNFVQHDANVPETERVKAKVKLKMSLKDSFIFLAQSPYIRLLAILVLSYGIAINLIEVSWKHQAKLLYPKAQEYGAFAGYISICTGLLSPFMSLFVGGNLIRRCGWRIGALATPVVLLVTGIGFFAFIIFRDQLGGFVSLFGVTPLFLAVIFGSIQNIMSKATKYSLFDPTKEMVYIPLDEEAKVKGKAAVDVVGSRLGKSSGSLLQQGLLFIFGSLEMITPYIGVLLFMVIFLWMHAVNRLGARLPHHQEKTS